MTQANHINRRKALTVVAAVPAALAVPAFAETITDPIFAAIAAYKATLKRALQLYNKCELAEHAAAKKHGRRPSDLIEWRGHIVGLYEIDPGRFARELGADKESIELEYRDAKRRYREAIRAGREWDKRAGIAPLRRESERAERDEDEAIDRMAKTKPTTPAGAAAFLEFVRRDMKGGNTEWHFVALNTIARTLASAKEVRL